MLGIPAAKCVYSITDTSIYNQSALKINYKVKTIGLYNSKAKNIISLSKILISKYKCKTPKDFSKLILLPGVGQKTASVYQNVILNYVHSNQSFALVVVNGNHHFLKYCAKTLM